MTKRGPPGRIGHFFLHRRRSKFRDRNLGPGTGKNVPVEVVVMAMRRVSFAALRVTRRALVFGRASSQNQKGSTHFHRAPALRKVIDLKPL